MIAPLIRHPSTSEGDKPPRILYVDDEPRVLDSVRRELYGWIDVDCADNGKTALQFLEQKGPYHVVVADMRMPYMNGIEFLRKARFVAPHTVRIMLTGQADRDTAIGAVNEGHVHSFLTKPCPSTKLAAALTSAVNQYEIQREERVLLEETVNGAIQTLTEILSSARPVLFCRGQKLKQYVDDFLGHFPYEKPWELQMAAVLYPIGYMCLPESVSAQAFSDHRMTPKEEQMLERVPEMTAHILGYIHRLEPVAEIIRRQNDSYDVASQDHPLPPGAQILKVLADLLDLESDGMSKTEAVEIMKQREGLYAPDVLKAVDAWVQSAPPPSHFVKLHELQVGQRLAKPIVTDSGEVLAPAGLTISAFLLKRLKFLTPVGGLQEPIEIYA